MLLPIKRLVEFPVMSLQTGSQLGLLGEPIIDPRNLTIIAFYVADPTIEDGFGVLHVSDIRELSDIGMIVDSSESIMPLDGLVRLQEIIDFGFQIDGIKVYDEDNNLLGKVEEYAIEAVTYTVQQLATKQSWFRSLTTASNVIHRSQIISVTNERITVKSAKIRDKVRQRASEAQQYINPFRPSTQPERITPASTPAESDHS